jgi:hypothetical protein
MTLARCEQTDRNHAGVSVGEVISLVALKALLAHTNRRALLSFAETQVRV